MPPPQLTTRVVLGDDHVTLRLAGEIDMDTAPAVRNAALRALRQHSATLNIDLSEVTFMDSTGLEVLLATRRRTEAEGGQLHIVDPTYAVLRVLEVTGVDRLFHIDPGAASEAVRQDERPHPVGPADDGVLRVRDD
jgi:anti-sigma B factor antagonist